MSRTTPPHSIEAEQALLGAILINNDAWGVVSGTIEPEQFYEPVHRAIYAAISETIASGRKATPITLKAALPTIDIAGISLPVYLARLAAEGTTVINAPDYAQLVRETWELREMGAIVERAKEAQIAPAQALREAWDEIDVLRARLSTPGAEFGGIGSFAKRVIEELQAPQEAKTVPTTGFTDFDRLIGGGYRPGRLIVIAGRPGTGKTVFAASSARRVARKGYGAAIFSLEVDGFEIAARMLADELSHTYTPVPYADILANRLAQGQRERVEEGARRLADIPVEIDAASGVGMFDLAAKARIICERWRKRGVVPGAIFIDYLGLIMPTDRYRGRKVDELGEIARACKELSKRLQVCVVLLSQLNRAVESREDKRPTIADLRESGHIEEHADVVGLLYRPSYYDGRDPKVMDGDPEAVARADARRHDLELALGKNRLGASTTVTLWCDVASSCVDNRRNI
jgi:replicative DNA helicase